MARISDFCAAVDAGSITLRGDIEAPDAMMARLMDRYGRINQIVAEQYQPALAGMGL